MPLTDVRGSVAPRPLWSDYYVGLLEQLRAVYDYRCNRRVLGGERKMATVSRSRRLALAATCLVSMFTMRGPLRAQSGALSITLTGQSMIRSDIRAHAPSEVPVITSLLKGDVVFTNFEATIVDEKKGQSHMDGRFLSPPEALDALQTFGFNLVSLSNNHAFDLKVPGIQNTLEEARRLKLAHAGTGNTIDEAVAPGYLHTPQGTVALVAMASGLIAEGGSATATRPGVNELRVEGDPGNQHPNEQDAQRILQSIRNARKQADLVIVYEHNHVFDKPFSTIMLEELPERLAPPDWLKKWTHAEVDAGADIIVMHGAPLLHGVEIYHDRPIFYDLGNFIFQAPPIDVLLDEPINWESVVAYVEFQGKNLKSITFRPVAQNKIGQGQADTQDEHTNNLFLQTRGLPTLATGEQARYILERLRDLSRPFGTTVEVKGDRAAIKLKGGN
jgi:poly-gamma-glutamate capsule biosynthesis protein CapA/YwtB (metallophosphatase superfamily)